MRPRFAVRLSATCAGPIGGLCEYPRCLELYMWRPTIGGPHGFDDGQARLNFCSPSVKYAVVGEALNNDPRYPLREDFGRNCCRVCLSTNVILASE